jgi:hypothetical protein
MTDDELRRELGALGIDQDSHRSLLLLPMVQVAWADGVVQPAERDLIVAAARANGLVTGHVAELIERWLDTPPPPEMIERGRKALVELAYRHHGIGSDLPSDTLEQVFDMCKEIAEAAGGLFGIAFTVDAKERAALDQIARGLRVGRDALLDELPEPDGGSWSDL